MAALLAALLPLAVWSSGPREEVNAAIDKLLTARSYTATLASADGRTLQQLEFAAPGRYRVRSNGTEQVIIGDLLYHSGDEQSLALPVPQDVLERWRDPARLVETAETMQVTAAGDEAVAGVPARKYRIDSGAPPPSALTVWIDADGFPLQILRAEASGVPTLIRYARINDPEIRIASPK